MAEFKVVDREQWLQARLDHLAKEKEFTRHRDQISAERRELPAYRVEKDYRFEGPQGEETLADLFDGRSQLLVYHFMFHPDWEQGCKSCSFLADNYCRSVVHLAERDVTLVTVSKAPLSKIEPFKKRMGWDFKWVSSGGSDFNRDFHVSFTESEIQDGKAYYNYHETGFPELEGPGLSVFRKDDDGTVFHTYSSYGRGLDMLIGTYHILDLMPKGRDEGALSYSMEWIRHHDRYGTDADGFH